MSLQSSIDQLTAACQRSGFTVYVLLEKPYDQIMSFAQTHAICFTALREICALLLERLEILDRDLKTFGKSALH